MGPQFTGVSLAGGSGYLFMTIALTGMSFTQVAWARAILGAMALLGICAFSSRFRLPRRAITWAHVTVLAVTNLVTPYLLLSWAQQHITSSLAVVFNATTPIMTVIWAAFIFGIERARLVQVIGLFLGIAGVTVIMAPWQAGEIRPDFWGSAACLLATTSFGFSFAYIRTFVRTDELPGASLSVLMTCIAALMMLLLTPFIALSPVRLDWSVAIAIIILGVVGSGLAVLWTLNVIRGWGASVASSSLFLSPVVGMMLGVLILGETITWNQLTGAAITLVSLMLIQPPGIVWLRSLVGPKPLPETG